MTGPELCKLMRLHRVTIRELSQRTGIPMKRIRLRRETGLDLLTSIDWWQHITGATELDEVRLRMLQQHHEQREREFAR